MTLLINENSDIKLGYDGYSAFIDYAWNNGFIPPYVEYDTDYSGGIIYYNSESESGTPITIEQVAAIDYAQPYIRLTGDGISNVPSTSVTPVRFTDVQPGAYYYDAVTWAVREGITSGTTAATFAPDAPCTRAQVMSFLWRAAGSPKMSGSNPFVDVASGDYYYDAVLWAVENGITAGSTSTTFSPESICTRAQAMTFLYRAKNSPAVSGTNSFTDLDPNAYYIDAVQWAVNTGVTSGTTLTTFSPSQDCTRAQIISFLYRCI